MAQRRKEAFIESDRELAPTPGAADHAIRLGEAGHGNYNLGQGSEKTPLTAAAKKLIYANLLSPAQPVTEETALAALDSEMDYSGNNAPKLEAAVSGWSKRIFGFGGTPQTTTVAQQLGRGLMGDAVNKWGAIYRDEYKCLDPKPVALVPANSWALTNQALKEAGFDVVEYPVDPDDVAGSYEKALQEQAEKGRVVGISYFNFPHNATGLHLTREDNLKIKTITDKHNRSLAAAGHAYKTMLLYDMPYFAACKKNLEGNGNEAYLDTGMEGVFDENDFDPANKDPVITPVSVCCSGSKFFRTARRGFAWGHFTKDIVKAVRGKMNLSGNGPRRDPEFYDFVTQALQPENDSVWHEQLDADRRKFGDNYEILCETFGKAVIKGGPNLVALIKLPDVFNKAVMCHDGKERTIGAPGSKASRQDALEIIANGTPEEAGTLLVDGDTTLDTKEDLFRIALAMPTEEFKLAAARLARIYKYIADSPPAPLSQVA